MGSQTVGFAGRIAVNANLAADPSRLVVFQTTPPTRGRRCDAAEFPLRPPQQRRAVVFAADRGSATATAPFSGSIHSFMRQVISQQGAAAEAAANLKQGQDVVFNSLQQRFNDSAAVNIDQEMANLLSLQNAYAANARVLTTVKEMLDALLRM